MLRPLLVFAALLSLPMVCVSQQVEDEAQAPAFELNNDTVLEIIAAAAAKQVSAKPVAEKAAAEPADEPQDTAGVTKQLAALEFRGRRGFHHMDCDSINCVAYDANGDALYSIPRDQYYGHGVGKDSDEGWLSCQSGNNLLSTFERHDHCQGITTGIPGALLPIDELPLPHTRL